MKINKIKKLLIENGYNTPEKIIRTSNDKLIKIKGLGKKAIQLIRIEYGQPIFNWSIEEQCKHLNIPYRAIKSKFNSDGFYRFQWYDENIKRWMYPEDWVLNHFTNKGWIGVNCEGRFIVTILKYFCDTELSNHGQWSHSFLYIPKQSNYLKSVKQKHAENIKKCPDLILNTAIETILTRFDYSKDPPKGTDPFMPQPLGYHHVKNWDRELIRKAVNNIGRKKLVEIFHLIQNDPENYRFGWPDITMFKGEKAIFMEVKTIDKLGERQINLWENVIKPAKINFKVIILRPKLYKGVS